MPNLNRVMLMGNLTRDPELRAAGASQVCQFGLAINRTWKDQQGEKHEEVTFVDCQAWGKTGELIAQYVRKGQPLYVEGRLRLEQWQDKDGSDRRAIKVVVEAMQFLARREDGGGQAEPIRRAADPQPAAKAKAMATAGKGKSAPAPAGQQHDSVAPEDIPF